MNTTYAQQSPPQHDMGHRDLHHHPHQHSQSQSQSQSHAHPRSHVHPPNHLHPHPHSHPHPMYPPPNIMPLPPHYTPLAVSKAPIPDSIHVADNIASVPGAMPRACEHAGKRYQLVVLQQPQRARMCGFGDKDRRPITPPPCVKLIVTDVDSGKESDFNTIDHGTFVLNVDLWSADGSREVNLVKHTAANSPSISSTIPVSYGESSNGSLYPSHMPGGGIKIETGYQVYSPYPPSGSSPVNLYSHNSHNQHHHHHHHNNSNSNSSPVQAYNGPPPYQQGYGLPPNSQAYPPNGYPQSSPPHMHYAGPATHASSPTGGSYTEPAHPQISPYSSRGTFPPQSITHRLPVSATPPQGMFTRNLIGSLAASAFRLTDQNDKIGIWFVLQDLSVRTEGEFRLRFSFVNVGDTTSHPPPLSSGAIGPLNTGKAPVLARCFSEVFTVYSAKRFPGVVESTDLSKCFATQGIKIPIRKDGKDGKGEKGEKGGKEGDFEDDD